MVYSAASRYHLSLCGFLILLLGPSEILASRERKSALRGSKSNADELPFSGNFKMTRRLKKSDAATEIKGSKSKNKSSVTSPQSLISSSTSASILPAPSTTVGPVPVPLAEMESSSTGTITEPSVPAPVADRDNTTNRVRIPVSPDRSRINSDQEITSSSSGTSTNIEFPIPVQIAETDNISARVREPIYPDRSVGNSAQDTISESPGDSTNTDGSLTKNWDDACPRQAKNLITCVKATKGSLENCKNCVKAASTISSNSWFALDSCGKETKLCNGCATFVEAYYSCGMEAPESGGQAGASFGGFNPDQLP